MKKKYLLYTLLPALVLAFSVLTATHAATTSPKPTNTIAEAIAKKFNLNTADVEAVIEETLKSEHQKVTTTQPAKIDFLAKAVAGGKITQAQADLIKAKHDELRLQMDFLKDKAPAERTTLMQKHLAMLKQWAKENNIPEQYVLMGELRNAPGKHGFMHKRSGMMNLKKQLKKATLVK